MDHVWIRLARRINNHRIPANRAVFERGEWRKILKRINIPKGIYSDATAPRGPGRVFTQSDQLTGRFLKRFKSQANLYIILADI